MPALPPVPGVVKVGIHFHAAEDLAVTVRQFYSYSGGAPTNSDAVTLANAFLTEAAAHLYPLMADSTSLEFVFVQDLSSSSGGEGSSSAGTVGTRGTEELPVGTALLQNHQIQRRYRGGKPRSYWPFGVQGDLADGSTWTGGAITNFNTGLNAFIAGNIGQVAGATTISNLVNVSYYEGFTSVLNPVSGRTRDVPKLRTGGPVVDVITGSAANGKPGSQRRRYQR